MLEIFAKSSSKTFLYYNNIVLYYIGVHCTIKLKCTTWMLELEK